MVARVLISASFLFFSCRDIASIAQYFPIGFAKPSCAIDFFFQPDLVAFARSVLSHRNILNVAGKYVGDKYAHNRTRQLWRWTYTKAWFIRVKQEQHPRSTRVKSWSKRKNKKKGKFSFSLFLRLLLLHTCEPGLKDMTSDLETGRSGISKYVRWSILCKNVWIILFKNSRLNVSLNRTEKCCSNPVNRRTWERTWWSQVTTCCVDI